MKITEKQLTDRYGPTRPLDGALEKIWQLKLDRIATVRVIRDYRNAIPSLTPILDEIEWTLTGVAPAHFIANPGHRVGLPA